jgi:UDP:flavonoid glycosyltransferase YjiC (YdhE family)
VRVLLASSLGGAGHLEPVAAVGRALAADGHDATLLVPPALETSAGASGLRVVVGAEPPSAEVDEIRERMARGPASAVAGLVDRELFASRCTAAMLADAARLVAELRPDAVLRESCEYASAIAAARAGVPVVTVAISQARLELDVLRMVTPILDGFEGGTAAAIAAAPYLSAFPERLDPSPWPRTVRYRDAAAPAGPPPDGWSAPGPPRVYATFGSVVGHTHLAQRAFGAVLDALGDLDVRALLTVGRRVDPGGIRRVPANVRVERWLPQAAVLAAADVVVCHGGSGTVLGALGAGVPLVVCPLYADNARNGAAVAAAGAGVALAPLEELAEPATALRVAVLEVLGSPTFAASAREVATELAGAAPIPAAVATCLGAPGLSGTRPAPSSR